jgi:hypothetical protein
MVSLRIAGLFCLLASSLVLVLPMPCATAQGSTIQVNFSTGSSFKFHFNPPATNLANPFRVSPGETITVAVTAEHVTGSSSGNIVLRFSTSPTPYIVPSGQDVMNYGTLGVGIWIQETRRISFDVRGDTTIGAALKVSVDGMDTSGGGSGWVFVTDLFFQVGVITTVRIFTFSMNVMAQGPTTLGPSARWTSALVSVTGDQWPSDATVILSVSGGGLIATLSSSTLSGPGQATISIQAPEGTSEGTYTITVMASCSRATPSTQTSSLPIVVVRPQLPDWIPIAAVSAVGAVAVVAVILLSRRKPKAPTTQPAYPVRPMYGPPKPAKPMHAPRVVEVRKKEEG